MVYRAKQREQVAVDRKLINVHGRSKIFKMAKQMIVTEM